MTGTRIGNWILEREVGRGPRGTVYRAAAVDPRGDQPVVAAVKVLALPPGTDPKLVLRFPAEMLSLRRLTHPNIARLYDAGVHAGTAYYASEWVEGTDAATLVQQSGNPGLSWRELVLSAAAQAARALKHGHHRSILHRDLKPANLIVCKDGTVKLTDFGVGKVFPAAPLSLPADPWGTAGFVAPEHFTGKPLTRKSDLYALGGVLYALLTGRPPFAAATAAEFMHKHCYMLPDRPANFVPKLPADIDELVCGLLTKDPTRRPASAAAVLDDLDRIRGKLERKGEKIVFPPAPDDPTGQHAALSDEAATEATAGRGKRDQVIRAGVLVAMLVAVVGLILFAFFRPRPPAEELFAEADRLSQSSSSEDWDKAWDDYLDPLARHYPEWQPDKVKGLKAAIVARKELNRTVEAGAKAEFPTEAARLYYRGLRLAQAGDFPSAKRLWQAVAAGFADRPDEARWVVLAKAGVAAVDAKSGTGPGVPTADAVLAAAEQVAAAAAKLRSAGQVAEAESMLNVFIDLYRDHPVAVERLRRK
jgi:hypothetical protein